MEKTTNDMESNFVQDYLFAIFLSWLPLHIIIPNRFYFLDGKAMDVLPQIPGYFVLYGIMYLFVLLGIFSVLGLLIGGPLIDTFNTKKTVLTVLVPLLLSVIIYYINNSESSKTADIMKKIKQNSYQIEKSNLDMIQKDFLSESCNEKETLDIIKKNYEENNIILDPHTAVGVGVANKLSFNDCVVLSTAHPCKFPEATNNAINKYEKLPEEFQYVLKKDENFKVLKNNIKEVKKFVKSKV